MMKSLLFIVLTCGVISIQSSSIPVFTSPYCGDYMADLPMTDSWISLCGSSVQSLIIPPNKTVAFYEQCRDDDAMNSADPMYKTIIQTTTESNCVSFFVNEGEDINQVQVSIQFIDDFSKVCQEYADHIVKFCSRSNGFGCDSKECHDAMEGAEEMKQQCDEYSVNSPSFRHRRNRYRHRREASTSSEESTHQEKEIEQEEQEEQEIVHKVRQSNTKRLEMRLHHHLIKTTTTNHQQKHNSNSQQQRNQTGISMPYKKFMRKSHRICEPRRQRTAITCSLVSLITLLCICCCCARCCYKKRCQRRQNQLLPAVPLEEDAPQRIVVAAIVPISERQQQQRPQIILSRVIDPQEAKQIEADHQMAVQLSKQ